MAKHASTGVGGAVEGILKLSGREGGMLLDPNRPDSEAVSVPGKLIRLYGLPEGAMIAGPLQSGSRGMVLTAVDTIGGLEPDDFGQRTPFRQLVAIDPSQRFRLAVTGEIAMRLVDLVAPIGKGTRGLIVSPPKAGKTTLLEQIARAVRLDDPRTRIVVLLLDERPEEVTHFRRTVEAEVFASSSDESVSHRIGLSELMLAHIRTELECGRDVLLLVDSLTRMARTFNLGSRGQGRSLTGGLDAGALEIPRRFLGLARNIEGGGSVTIVATVLVDTGSRMDQFIFEEFKGTGNSEIVLDRGLADTRLFPAINLPASGTRKDHLLYSPEESRRLDVLRRLLAQRTPEQALKELVDLLSRFPTNQAFLESIQP